MLVYNLKANAAKISAPNKTAAKKATATDSEPSNLELFCADVRTLATDQNMLGCALGARDLAIVWCAANNPKEQGKRDTPEASILSALGTAQDSGKLTLVGMSYIRGKEARTIDGIVSVTPYLIVHTAEVAADTNRFHDATKRAIRALADEKRAALAEMTGATDAPEA